MQARGAEPQRIKGDYSPLSSKRHASAKVMAPARAAADDAWQTAPDLPVALQDNAVDSALHALLHRGYLILRDADHEPSLGMELSRALPESH